MTITKDMLNDIAQARHYKNKLEEYLNKIDSTLNRDVLKDYITANIIPNMKFSSFYKEYMIYRLHNDMDCQSKNKLGRDLKVLGYSCISKKFGKDVHKIIVKK